MKHEGNFLALFSALVVILGVIAYYLGNIAATCSGVR